MSANKVVPDCSAILVEVRDGVVWMTQDTTDGNASILVPIELWKMFVDGANLAIHQHHLKKAKDAVS